jgi:hypothetical protein
MDKPITKFQYPINKSVESILNWLETEMYEIPSVYYKTSKIDYYAELINSAIEVHYRMRDLKTRECIGDGIQFSLVVREFDRSTSVIVGKFYTHDEEVEKLAYSYLAKLGIIVDAKWQAEAARIAAGSEAADAAKQEQPADPTPQPTDHAKGKHAALVDKWAKMTSNTKENFRKAAKTYRQMEKEYQDFVLDGGTKKAKPTLKEWRQRLIDQKVEWNVSESRLQDVLDMLSAGIIDKI